MNSNSYLDLGVTTYRSINPNDKEGDLIRVDNADHITSGYYLNDTEYMQFIWDGYEYDEWDELEYIFTNSLRLFKEDYKIYVNANSSYYSGKTQIETTSELTGPRQSDTSGYAVVYIYKPVDFIIGSLQEYSGTLPVVTIVEPLEGAYLSTETPTLSWEYYDLEGVEQSYYQVQISNTSDFSIIIHDSYAQASGDTSYVSPPLEENIWYWRVRVRDGLRWSEWAQSNFAVDLPPRGSILINEGDEATGSESVILTLPAEDMLGVANMCLSNDGVTWSSWLPYSSTLSWTLADPTYDGIKYIFVIYRDTTGHESIPFLDSIILDRGVPSIPGKPVGTKELSYRSEVPINIRFTWSPATDSLSSTLNYLVTITDGNGTILVEDALTYDTSYIFYPIQGAGTYYARVRALDMAGNSGESSPLSDGVDIVLQKSIIREYDVNGNMIEVKEDVGGQVETLSVLAYDAFNKLKTYTEGSLVTTMVYDGDGRRVRKTLEDTASSTVESDISYIYDGRRILYEVDETGFEPSVIASYVYGINLIARLEGISGSTAYYLYNGHGDVTGLVDIDGVLIGPFDYEAFGGILEETGMGETPFKYAGEYLDRETGLYLMGARYYASGMGRWITEDPYKGSVDDPLSLNLYVFVRNSPLIYVDPSGHMSVDLLRDISLLYNYDILDAESTSIFTLLLNGLGVYTAFHEIAQLNIAKRLHESERSSILEYSIKSKTEKNRLGRYKNYRADIVSEILVWEVKPLGTDGTIQLQKYITNGDLKAGFFMDPITDIPIFGDYKMGIVFDKPGQAHYYFYQLDEKGKQVIVPTAEVKREYNKKAIVAGFVAGTIIAATLFEDVVTLGFGTADDIPSLIGALSAAGFILAH